MHQFLGVCKNRKRCYDYDNDSATPRLFEAHLGYGRVIEQQGGPWQRFVGDLPSESRKSAMENKVILLVEDNANDEALTLRALKRGNIGNEVVVVRDGAEAVEYLLGAGTGMNEQSRGLPQLVLLDLKLPKLDGLEVLRRIRDAERTKALPVVIFTSSKEERDIVEGYRLGANSYIRKPIDFAAFAEAVRQLGLYWLILNEPIPGASGP